MTKGYNTRKEVLHELKLAMELEKERIQCKHEYLNNSDFIVKINRKSIDLLDNEYIEFSNQEGLLRKILNILSPNKKVPQVASLQSPDYIPKLEITNLKMNVVDRDPRVNFELWNKGKVIVKLSSVEGIATDKKGNEVSPRAREPGDLIAIVTRKHVSLNFKHYREKYEEIIIIKKHNGRMKQENFKISRYLKKE